MSVALQAGEDVASGRRTSFVVVIVSLALEAAAGSAWRCA